MNIERRTQATIERLAAKRSGGPEMATKMLSKGWNPMTIPEGGCRSGAEMLVSGRAWGWGWGWLSEVGAERLGELVRKAGGGGRDAASGLMRLAARDARADEVRMAAEALKIAGGNPGENEDALFYAKGSSTTKAVLAEGCSPNALNGAGYSPLGLLLSKEAYGASFSDEGKREVLLAAGGRTVMSDSEAEKLWDAAARGGRLKALTRLFDEGLPNSMSEAAARRILSSILSRGMDSPKALSMLAARAGSEKLAEWAERMLEERGAASPTATSIATGCSGIMNLLRKWGLKAGRSKAAAEIIGLALKKLESGRGAIWLAREMSEEGVSLSAEEENLLAKGASVLKAFSVSTKQQESWAEFVAKAEAKGVLSSEGALLFTKSAALDASMQRAKVLASSLRAEVAKTRSSKQRRRI